MFIEGNDNRGVIVLDGIKIAKHSEIIWATRPETAEPISETAKATLGKLVSRWIIEEGKLVCQWLIED